MRILVLGGTGFIGTSVVRELVSRGHDVAALARSERSAAALRRLGAEPVHGDMAAPASWVGSLPELDAVVHAAIDLGGDMEGAERRLLEALLPKLTAQRVRPRFLYTGGCWLFGATGDRIATEASPFAPLPAFAWTVPNLERILAHPGLDGIVIHAGMVHDTLGGVFAQFEHDAGRDVPIRVVGGPRVRWPLVHRDDLAVLFALALERARPGSSYLGVTNVGVPVGRIARAFARRHGVALRLEIVSADAIARERGEWARGRALDQRLSGQKARRELGWKPHHVDPEREIELLEPDPG